MSWRVEFRPEVEHDVAQAADWYDARQPGLGTKFVEEIIRVWDALAENPCFIAAAIRPKTSDGDTPTDFPIA